MLAIGECVRARVTADVTLATPISAFGGDSVRRYRGALPGSSQNPRQVQALLARYYTCPSGTYHDLEWSVALFLRLR